MSNPHRILQTLDQRLHSPAELTLFGRSALALYRPATLDLILTKMARGDRDDLSDIAFLLKQDAISFPQLESAFDNARVPDIEEIRELFESAKVAVRALLKRR